MAAIITVQVAANEVTLPRPMTMPEPSICQTMTAQATAVTPNTIATEMPSAASSTPRTAWGLR